VKLFTINCARIDLVVMDVVMPWLSGPDAYAKISALQPGVRVIFTTGYTAEAASLISILDKGAVILQKPYSLTSLSQIIRGALDRALVK
jgi:polar amino acid transport system substrate-binding protein